MIPTGNLDEVQLMKLILVLEDRYQDPGHTPHHIQGVILGEGILMMFIEANQGHPKKKKKTFLQQILSGKKK